MWFDKDTDADIVLEAYNRDPSKTLDSLLENMMTVPYEDVVTVACRNMVQRCPRVILFYLVMRLRSSAWVNKHILRFRKERAVYMDTLLTPAFDGITLADLAATLAAPINPTTTASAPPPAPTASSVSTSPSSPSSSVSSTTPITGATPVTTAPSSTTTEAQQSSQQQQQERRDVVTPVPMRDTLSLHMEALGCPKSYLASTASSGASVSYSYPPVHETSLMTDLERQFVSDPFLIYCAQTHVALPILYHYLKHHYPGTLGDRSESDMIALWNTCGGGYPLRILSLLKDAPYIRHVLMHNGTQPDGHGYYHFKPALLPSNVVRFQ